MVSAGKTAAAGRKIARHKDDAQRREEELATGLKLAAAAAGGEGEPATAQHKHLAGHRHWLASRGVWVLHWGAKRRTSSTRQ